MSTVITLENYREHKIGNKARRLFVMKERGLNVPELIAVNSVPEEGELLSLLGDGVFSVRSSAFCEDSASLSFAGQFDTFLSVDRCDVLAKIAECFASSKKENVLSYCKENGICPSDIKMTVIVQRMIDSETSGVVFSSNPMGILNESVIVMGRGTGDNVVEEKVDVTTCYYNRTDRRYYTERRGEDSPELSDGMIESLISMCEAGEEIFGEMLDMEYAVFGGEIYVLQARPITALDTSSPLILDNSNIVESYPGISLPLTVSFVKEAYSGVFRGLAGRILRDERLLKKYDETFLNMTGAANGRVYYKISNWYTMLSFLPLSKKIIPIWQDMMGVGDKSYEKGLVKLSPAKRLSTYFNIISEALSVRKNMEKLNAAFPDTEKYFRDRFKPDSTLSDIRDIYGEVSRRVLKVWDITLLNDLYAFVFTGLLKAELKKTGTPDYERQANEFISGISNIESMKPIRAMIRLADSEDSMLDELSGARDDAELMEMLEKYPAFRDEFYNYIDRFGDRSPEELKLETVTFRESPLLLMKKVRELSSDRAIFENTKAALLSEEGREASLPSDIKKRRRRIHFFAKKASIGIMNREVSRLNRTRMYGMVRSMLLRAGEILAEEGKLKEVRDVFYLTKDEVFYGDSDSFAGLVKERREHYRGFYGLPAFSRLIFSGEEFDKRVISADTVSRASADRDLLGGTPSSPGVARGEAVVVKDACNPPDTAGKIIVAKMTDPGWVFLLSNSKGIISEKGSLLSHTAIISRELKIPAVVGVKDVSEIIRDGDIIELNGDSGSVRILESGGEHPQKEA